MATFKVVTGVMGSGKSANAIITVLNLRRNNHSVLVIKPYCDTRDGDVISSRIIKDVILADRIISEADQLDKILETVHTEYIVVDEAHMLQAEQITALYDICARRNINVILYGLRMSWKGKPFAAIQLAMGYADTIESIDLIDKNGELITHHVKLINGSPAPINEDEKEIAPGDFNPDMKEVNHATYVSVSRRDFYTLYDVFMKGAK